jgi:purine-nucleoside phosphorylase
VIAEARDFVAARVEIRPRVAVVLGSGLGAFADELSDAVRIRYPDIPHWPGATAIGHAGELVFGRIGALAVAVMAGRVHLYEGYAPQQVTFGVRVLGSLGVRSLVLTNAAGGINLDYSRGALVLISDHINLQGSNPLVGQNQEQFGPRFPDMSEAYSKRYREIARATAAGLGIDLKEGVYAAMLGPSYETPAEIRYLRAIGADLVGMSTVAESIVAAHMGIQVLGISCVTNMAAGILPQKLSHEEVMETGAAVRETFIQLLKAVLPKIEA